MDDFKKIILPILGVVVFIVAVGFFLRKMSNQPLWPSQTPNPTTMAKGSVLINNISISVDKAVSSKERKTGLSGKSELEKGTGMLFILDKTDSIPVFWMKDMKIAIDIIWIKAGKIIEIDKNASSPEEGTPDNQLTRYSPKLPVEYVLEVASGFCEENGIKVGDPVQIL